MLDGGRITQGGICSIKMALWECALLHMHDLGLVIALLVRCEGICGVRLSAFWLDRRILFPAQIPMIRAMHWISLLADRLPALCNRTFVLSDREQSGYNGLSRSCLWDERYLVDYYIVPHPVLLLGTEGYNVRFRLLEVGIAVTQSSSNASGHVHVGVARYILRRRRRFKTQFE